MPALKKKSNGTPSLINNFYSISTRLTFEPQQIKIMKKFLILVLIVSAFGCEEGDKDFLITIKTSQGEMKAILYNETPQHKANFIKLINNGFYDSLIFHRVIQNFMVQGGDPESKNAQPGKQLGSGGPGYTIPAEFNPKLFHKKGALSAARLGDNRNPEKESSGSQFYLVQGVVSTKEQLTTDMNRLASSIGQYFELTGDTILRNELIGMYQNDPQSYMAKLVEIGPTIEQELNTSFSIDFPSDRVEAYTTIGGAQHLDDQYTVFGEVVKGLDVIDKIAAQQTDQRDRPFQDIHMVFTLEEVSQSEITSKFGYQYPAEVN